MLTHHASLAEAAADLRGGKLDLKNHLNKILDRFDEVEPQVEALLPETNRRTRLLKEAEALEDRYPEGGESRPPLFGILMGVKDIYRVDGFPTQCGIEIPPEEFAGPEAVCVTKLKAAGALVLGKTVTTECAYFEPGPTRNPCNPGHTPGGSSSGSAAAVAAGFCQVAFGSQTNGSTIRPAAFCGIVGYKPSFGRIETDGLLYFARELDHVGLFTQDVSGMALVASVLCKNWQSNDTSTLNDDNSNRLPVLGVPEGPYLQQASAEGLVAYELQLEQLEEKGYEVRRIQVLDDIAAVSERHLDIMAIGLAREHANLFDKYLDQYRPLTVALIERGRQLGEVALESLLAARSNLIKRLHTSMAKAGIDLWVAPAAPGPAPEGMATGDPAMNLAWTHVEMPILSVPSGTAANGLPLGLQLVAPFGKDEQLLAWAEPIGQILHDPNR